MDFPLIDELLQIKITTIATGKQQSAIFAPANTTTISSEDMELMAALDVDEVLESVPGLHVARNPMSYYNPTYSLGGIASIYNPEVLVLLNGIPINTLYTGGRILVGYGGGIPVAMVERIEVIRGSGSAVYGADVSSGVINIVTKTGEDIDGTKVGVRVGSYARQDAWVQHGGRYQGWKLGLSVNFSETEGQDGIIKKEDAQTQYDRLFNTHASLAPGAVDLSRRNWDMDVNLAKSHWKFHTLFQQRDKVGFGAGGAQALSPGVSSSERTYLDLSYDNRYFTNNWELLARAGYADVSYLTKEFLVFPPGAFNGAFPEGMRGTVGVSERHSSFELTGNYKGWANHFLRIGAGYRYNEIYEVIDKRNFGVDPFGEIIPPTTRLVDISGTSAAFLPTGNRSSWNVLAQDIWTLNDQWEMTYGARYYQYSDFGSTFNPRVALVWKTSNALTTKFLYGKTFRPPSFQELYQANNPVALGNPNLKPEEIQTYEIAFDYRPSKKWHIGLSAFVYDLTNKIIFVPDAQEASYYAQNAGAQKGKGFVIEGGWQLAEQFVLTGSYAFQRATDQDDHKVANGSPQQDIHLRGDWKFLPNWHLNTQFSWIIGRERAFNDPRPALDDYVNVDLALHYKKSKSPWEVTLAVRNLLDSDIREPTPGPDETGMIKIPYDLPMAGMNYFLEFRYQLSP